LLLLVIKLKRPNPVNTKLRSVFGFNESGSKRPVCRTVTTSRANDRPEEIKNVTKGKEDDKVYRGINKYKQYRYRYIQKEGVAYRYGVLPVHLPRR
jgi:hypothetical protein